MTTFLANLARIFHQDSARQAQNRDGWVRDATTRGRVPSQRSSAAPDARVGDAASAESFCSAPVGFEPQQRSNPDDNAQNDAPGEICGLSLRAAEPSDAAALSALIGSEGVFEGTSQLPMMPLASRVERFAAVDPAGLLLVAGTMVNGQEEIVGMVGLHLAQPGLRRAHVRGLGICVAKVWQGQGVGQLLMQAALHWADQWAGILRIELAVLIDNERAIALYERHGFVREGVMRKHILRNGMYADALMMARLHPSPPK